MTCSMSNADTIRSPIYVAIQEQPLSLDDLWHYLAAAEGGGIAIFGGTTRRVTGGLRTTQLSYEAHESMALSEMRRLAEEAATRWDTLRIGMMHRIGIVPVSETSVLIGVATRHRGPAFEAARFLIDELKVSVPVWKKEHFEDGSTEWQGDAWVR
jgi:molybdopterin synthase catalytic subunit